MRFKELGKTGEKIPVIGIGTWSMGKKPKEEIEALRLAIKLKMNFIDTAEIYGNEEMIGEAIKIFNRDEFFIATKVAPNNFRYKDVVKACEGSLKRLGIKQIDLYQLHWPNPKIPIEETMKAMEKLAQEGKIRYIGVSNFSVEQMIEAQNTLKKFEIVSNQVEYSLLARDIEKDILPFCEKEKITIIAYSPLARGEIFEKKHFKLFEKLQEIGKRYGRNSVQVALSWLISKKPVIAIPKASNLMHVKENAEAADLELKKEDIDEINRFLNSYSFSF